MSAFNVPRPHIAAIVRAAAHGGQLPDVDGWKAVSGFAALMCVWCDKLARANAESVAYRYQEAPESAMLVPFLTRELVAAPILTAADLVEACGCLEYQACEPPSWEGSACEQFLTALKSWANRKARESTALRARSVACWPITERVSA